ncbi:MAG: transposase [Gammaproteobacteria bacterium]|nr:MAG: transposase [Gammaproteobacteria bacterium]
MSSYKRIFLPNNSYFFTVVTANRNPFFAGDENVQLLKTAFFYVQSRKPFKIEAICILPDHLHCIWTMLDDSNYSIRWQMIKTDFSRRYRYQNREQKQTKIWQSRYWEHVIRDQDDFDKHVDYIHYNPVRHGLVKSVKDWSYSSFNKYVTKGYYDSGWGDCEPDSTVGMWCE